MREQHGMADSKEYNSWCHAKARCYNPKSEKYRYYGGRGIRMCEEWRKSFAAFYRDMGSCPPGMTLERKDTDGNYGPDNCVWASWTVQQGNRRFLRRITHNGLTLTLPQWAQRIGITAVSLRARLSLGMTTERALTPGPLKRGFGSMDSEMQLRISRKAAKARWSKT